MNPLRKLLDSKYAVLGDGAWGTTLFARGVPTDAPPEAWNLERSDAVAEVAAAYVAAGADLLWTNTFGANAARLASVGQADKAAAMNAAGVRIARDAAGPARAVVGCVGPTGWFQDGQTPDPRAVRKSTTTQARALLDAGADGLVVETVSTVAEMRAMLGILRSTTSAPLLCSFCFRREATGELRTYCGRAVGDAVRIAVDAGVDAIGANCGVLDFDDYRRLAAEMKTAAPSPPIFLRPNAGQPIATSDGWRHPPCTDAFGEFAIAAWDAGIWMVGGCCGTTPAAIGAANRGRSFK